MYVSYVLYFNRILYMYKNFIYFNYNFNHIVIYAILYTTVIWVPENYIFI